MHTEFTVDAEGNAHPVSVQAIHGNCGNDGIHIKSLNELKALSEVTQ